MARGKMQLTQTGITENNVLKSKIHLFIIDVYRLTKNSPKDELYGLVSQIRRAAFSIMLNF